MRSSPPAKPLHMPSCIECAQVLTMTSGSSFTHPDTGANIFAGFFDVDLELVRRFPELRHIEQLNLIIIGTTPRVYIVPNPDAPKR
jgi:hypothetical protein